MDPVNTLSNPPRKEVSVRTPFTPKCTNIRSDPLQKPSTFTGDQDKLLSQLAHRDRENKKLMKELKGRKAEGRALMDMETEVSHLRKELSLVNKTSRSEISSKDREIDTLKRTIAELQENMERDLKEFQGQVSDNQQRQEQLGSTLKDLQIRSKMKDQENLQLLRAVNEHSVRSETQAKQMSQYEKMLAQVQDQLTASQVELQSVKSMQKKRSPRTSEHERWQEIQTEQREMQDTIDSLRDQLKQAQSVNSCKDKSAIHKERIALKDAHLAVKKKDEEFQKRRLALSAWEKGLVKREQLVANEVAEAVQVEKQALDDEAKEVRDKLAAQQQELNQQYRDMCETLELQRQLKVREMLVTRATWELEAEEAASRLALEKQAVVEAVNWVKSGMYQVAHFKAIVEQDCEEEVRQKHVLRREREHLRDNLVDAKRQWEEERSTVMADIERKRKAWAAEDADVRAQSLEERTHMLKQLEGMKAMATLKIEQEQRIADEALRLAKEELADIRKEGQQHRAQIADERRSLAQDVSNLEEDRLQVDQMKAEVSKLKSELVDKHKDIDDRRSEVEAMQAKLDELEKDLKEEGQRLEKCEAEVHEQWALIKKDWTGIKETREEQEKEWQVLKQRSSEIDDEKVVLTAAIAKANQEADAAMAKEQKAEEERKQATLDQEEAKGHSEEALKITREMKAEMVRLEGVEGELMENRKALAQQQDEHCGKMALDEQERTRAWDELAATQEQFDKDKEAMLAELTASQDQLEKDREDLLAQERAVQEFKDSVDEDQKKVEEREEEVQRQIAEFGSREKEIADANEDLAAQREELKAQNIALDEKLAAMEERMRVVEESEARMQTERQAMEVDGAELAKLRETVTQERAELEATIRNVEKREEEVAMLVQNVEQREAVVEERTSQCMEKERVLAEREVEVSAGEDQLKVETDIFAKVRAEVGASFKKAELEKRQAEKSRQELELLKAKVESEASSTKEVSAQLAERESRFRVRETRMSIREQHLQDGVGELERRQIELLMDMEESRRYCRDLEETRARLEMYAVDRHNKERDTRRGWDQVRTELAHAKKERNAWEDHWAKLDKVVAKETSRMDQMATMWQDKLDKDLNAMASYLESSLRMKERERDIATRSAQADSTLQLILQQKDLLSSKMKDLDEARRSIGSQESTFARHEAELDRQRQALERERKEWEANRESQRQSMEGQWKRMREMWEKMGMDKDPNSPPATTPLELWERLGKDTDASANTQTDSSSSTATATNPSTTNVVRNPSHTLSFAPLPTWSQPTSSQEGPTRASTRSAVEFRTPKARRNHRVPLLSGVDPKFIMPPPLFSPASKRLMEGINDLADVDLTRPDDSPSDAMAMEDEPTVTMIHLHTDVDDAEPKASEAAEHLQQEAPAPEPESGPEPTAPATAPAPSTARDEMDLSLPGVEGKGEGEGEGEGEDEGATQATETEDVIPDQGKDQSPELSSHGKEVPEPLEEPEMGSKNTSGLDLSDGLEDPSPSKDGSPHGKVVHTLPPPPPNSRRRSRFSRRPGDVTLLSNGDVMLKRGREEMEEELPRSSRNTDSWTPPNDKRRRRSSTKNKKKA